MVFVLRVAAAALLAAVTESVTVTVTNEGKLKAGSPEGGLENGREGLEAPEAWEGNGLVGL